MIELAIEEKVMPKASIKVIGVGGAGGNTVNSIVDAACGDITCIVANTDAQALELSRAHHKVHIGLTATKGLGTGANPDLGKLAAEEDLEAILNVVGQTDIVFLTAGLGGGTGSGALPVVARALKEKDILTIAIVTKPFTFEGKRRAQVAQESIENLTSEVDTLIVIPNQRLIEVADANISMLDAFGMINEVLGAAVKGMCDIITKSGHINVDFADVRTIMKGRGLAVMGTGRAAGLDRAQQATRQALSSNLLETMCIDGAHAVLLNITGNKKVGLHEISEAASIIYEKAAEDAHIILGSVIDESMGDEISVTVIATGFDRAHCAMPETKHEHTKQGAVIQMPVAPEMVAPAAVVVQESADAASEKAETLFDQGMLDADDLDVPTFLRKQIQQ